jgi:hypothetical protein
VSAAVVRRDDFDVFDSAAAITSLVLDPGIRKLDVPVVIRELMLLSPASDSVRPFFWCLTSFSARSVFCLKEPLILALQFLFENDAAHRLTAFGQAVGGLHVRAVHP